MTTTYSAQDISKFYEENGYYLARGVFSREELAELETDFDRIVTQISATGENVNARWGGETMAKNRVEGFHRRPHAQRPDLFSRLA